VVKFGFTQRAPLDRIRQWAEMTDDKATQLGVW
jgi:hypothetical protein